MKRLLIASLLLVSSLVSLPAFAKMQAKPVEWTLGT